MIEKIANVLRIAPYHFFKNKTENINNSDTEDLFPRLPNSMKKQINTQIKTQIDQYMNDIHKEINEILEKY
jgi:signal recognition particle subunit SEC65